MPFEVFLALRYLKSRRRRRLARVTALVAIFGIAVGVGALIVALALANGFRDEMREKILRGTAHINVVQADGQPLRDYQHIAQQIEKISGVTNAFGTTYDGAVIIGPKGSAYAVLRGVDTANAAVLNEIGSSLITGSHERLREGSRHPDDPPAALVGSELANRTGVRVGEVVELIPASSAAAAQPGDAPFRRFVRVAGTFSSGLFEYDSTWIYLSLDVASRFAGADHAATVVSVQLADIYATKETAAQIQNRLGDSYRTIDWQEANRPLFTALALERRMGLFIIALIIVVAAFNITTTLILVVVERGRDIGILRAMGVSSQSIMGIFMLEGAIIGAIGGVLGAGLPADVYSISNIPFHSQLRDVVLAALVAFLLSLIATVYPARAAARVRPVEMLRDTN